MEIEDYNAMFQTNYAEESKEAKRGFLEVVSELQKRFPDPSEIEKESHKKEFVKLFGEYLKLENILQNYDEFEALQALQKVESDDKEAIERVKAEYGLSDEDVKSLSCIELLLPRLVQDYRSTYNDIREWIRREKRNEKSDSSSIDWNDVVFEVDLLKSQEINLDYILELIYERHKKSEDKEALIEEVRRLLRASLGHRAKESLVVEFINETDLDAIEEKSGIIEAFFTFAQAKQRKEAKELIAKEQLNEEAAKRYIERSLKREYASENGTELNEILPKMSPLNPEYLTKKQSVFEKIVAFVEKFKGVGGEI